MRIPMGKLKDHLFHNNINNIYNLFFINFSYYYFPMID